jgi:PEP-CTERM motif
MNYSTSIDLSTDYLGETASIAPSSFSFMRLLFLDSPCAGIGCSFIFASRHDYFNGASEASVSDGADLTRVVNSTFALSYKFSSPFSGPLAIDGGTLMIAQASVPEPSTFALTAMGVLLCALQRRYGAVARGKQDVSLSS